MLVTMPAMAQNNQPNNSTTQPSQNPESTSYLESTGYNALPVPAEVPVDSIRMVVLPETGEVGFIIPKSAALHYRNLVFDMVPALEQKIQLLEAASTQQLSLSDNRLDQIKNLEAQRDNLKEQVSLYASDTIALQEQLKEVNDARKKEIRRKKFWRSSNYLFMGATTILAVVLITN